MFEHVPKDIGQVLMDMGHAPTIRSSINIGRVPMDIGRAIIDMGRIHHQAPNGHRTCPNGHKTCLKWKCPLRENAAEKSQKLNFTYIKLHFFNVIIFVKQFEPVETHRQHVMRVIQKT